MIDKMACKDQLLTFTALSIEDIAIRTGNTSHTGHVTHTYMHTYIGKYTYIHKYVHKYIHSPHILYIFIHTYRNCNTICMYVCMYVGVCVSPQGFCGVAVVEQCDGWHRSPCAGPIQRAELPTYPTSPTPQR